MPKENVLQLQSKTLVRVTSYDAQFMTWLRGTNGLMVYTKSCCFCSRHGTGCSPNWRNSILPQNSPVAQCDNIHCLNELNLADILMPSKWLNTIVEKGLFKNTSTAARAKLAGIRTQNNYQRHEDWPCMNAKGNNLWNTFQLNYCD
jgi:hypothetical protein